MTKNYIYGYAPEKALESAKYITKRLGFLDIYTIAHLGFVAEMVHTQEYGRPIFGDRYIALAEGAVCSGIFSICAEAQKGNSLNFMRSQGGIKSFTDANLEVLSESDVDALGWTCDLYLNNEKWKELCRTDEWKLVFEQKAEDDSKVIDFKLLDFKNCILFLKDGKSIWEHMIG